MRQGSGTCVRKVCERDFYGKMERWKDGFLANL